MAEALMAEFADKEALVEAIRDLKQQGLDHMDAYTPFPVQEAIDALGLKRSKIPWIALAAGLTGGGLAYLIMWWINVVDYPLNVGSFPYHSFPAFIPITFEITVLSAGVTTFFAVLIAVGAPKLWDPVFEVEGFERASVDRYWLRVDDTDPRFDREAIVRAVEGQGALQVVDMKLGGAE